MPANSFVTVEIGHTNSGNRDYFKYVGPGDPGNGAGVAVLESTPWWGDADLAQQYADNSNYVSPSLNLDGDIGGNLEEVGFVYAFGGYRPSGTTEWSTKRKADDWNVDDVTQHWSGGFAVAATALSGITINQTGTTDGADLLTTEAGGSSTFTVVLDSAPVGADVTVSITGLATREGSLSSDTLTFTAGNWNTAQTVTVSGEDDDYDDGDRSYTLIATASNTGGYAGTEAAATTVKNTDNDTNGVTIAQTGTTDGSGNLLTTEASGTSTFTVVLDAKPSSNVTVSLTGNDTTEGSLSTSSLTFTTANWNTPQTVTITGVDDDIVDGDITTTLTATANNAGNYAGTESDTTTFKNTDDDSYGITITQTGTTDGADLLTTEAGSSSTFTVVLDAEPTDTVTVSITGINTDENSLDTDTLTFTTANWNTAQTITISGVNDDVDDGDITTTLTATANNAGGYAGTETATTTVKNTDDDTNGVSIAQTGTDDGAGNLLTTEAGGSSTFTVVLDAEPTADVTVSITGNDATEGSLSSSSLTFTDSNWNSAQSVTITGVNDNVDDGDSTTTLTATANNAGGYAGTESDTTTVKNTDDDTNGVSIAQTGTDDGAGNLLTTEDGSSSTFTVVLDAEPTADVTVSITGNDATEGTLDQTSLTFTTTNWSTAQTVTITGKDDDIVDGDITTTLTAGANNAGGYAGNESTTTTVKNTDNDTSTGGNGGGGTSSSNTTTPIKTEEEDGDNDGAIDSYEKSIDPATQQPYDRNGDGIPDYQQRTVATFESTSGKAKTLSSLNPILTDTEKTEEGSIYSKIALLFRGISAEAEVQTGETIGNLQQSVADNAVIRTSDQPDFRLVPEVIVEGTVPKPTVDSHQDRANQRFASTIHRIDYKFEDGDHNWNALFKPDETGQLRLLGYDPITGLGGILTDRNGDGKPDGATLFLQDNGPGDLNPDPFIIDDPVGAAELQSAPKLVSTSDGKGLTVEGPAGLGLWVRMKTTKASADWQNSLQLVSSQRGEIGGIGATRNNTNLGSTEFYLQSGEELRFHQSSHSQALQLSPSTTLKQNTIDESWQLRLDDAAGLPDGDYNDLEISITGHLTPDDLQNCMMAMPQNHLQAGVIDLRTVEDDSVTLNIEVSSNSDESNQLGFLRLDDRNDGLSLRDITADQSREFQNKAKQSILDPNGNRIQVSGSDQTTLQWTIESSDFGLYAPVMISSDGALHTASDSASQSQPGSLKLLGMNYFGFEDTLEPANSDWDYNDLTVRISVL